MRSESEISDEIDKAADVVAKGVANWPGMSYEQGVQDALSWVVGDTEEAPLSELD